MWFGGTHRANLAKFNLFQDLDFEKLKNARKLLLQVERVELSDEESGDQADDGKPPGKYKV